MLGLMDDFKVDQSIYVLETMIILNLCRAVFRGLPTMASSPSTTTNGACIWHPMPTGRATSSLGA